MSLGSGYHFNFADDLVRCLYSMDLEADLLLSDSLVRSCPTGP